MKKCVSCVSASPPCLYAFIHAGFRGRRTFSGVRLLRLLRLHPCGILDADQVPRRRPGAATPTPTRCPTWCPTSTTPKTTPAAFCPIEYFACATCCASLLESISSAPDHRPERIFNVLLINATITNSLVQSVIFMGRAMPGLYSTKGWRVLRSRQLSLEPLCRLCRQAGRTVPARVVDHVEPHRGDRAKFFDASNLQSLCKTCHDSIKQRAEKSGVLVGCALDGSPLCKQHPWFRGDAQ